MTRPTISVANHTQLFDVVHAIIKKEGPHCDLNHIDVSCVTELWGLFAGSSFDGNVSRWDVSRVTNFANVFAKCPFSGDVSKWDTHSALTMKQMFHSNKHFQGDLGGWDVSNVHDFSGMFANAEFCGDLSAWRLHPVAVWSSMFSVEKLKAMPQPNAFHWFHAVRPSGVCKPSDILQPQWQEHFDRMRPMLDSLDLELSQKCALYQRAWVEQQNPGCLPLLTLPDFAV